MRHLQDQEGASLEQVKKYIHSGHVDGYPITIKPLSLYNDNTRAILREIEYRITDTLSICDRHRNMSGIIALGKHEYDQIDALKMQITSRSSFHDA